MPLTRTILADTHSINITQVPHPLSRRQLVRDLLALVATPVGIILAAIIHLICAQAVELSPILRRLLYVLFELRELEATVAASQRVPRKTCDLGH